ncbi:MAG: LysR family transcriptional regulator [Spirochaetaceae bacterium]|jgi:DNA-binding transcriptional LysR family regulator|nr:LysR family transcriptional regulator [Spirochaetaceae bacterium]
MEQRQLLNFLSVCEEKYITRAAERRFITRQGLSKSLRELEDELGVPLFERNRNGVELTEYGRVLEKAARAWTTQHDYILETLKAMKEKSGSRLFVGIADSIVWAFPPRFFSGFLAARPEIDLSIRTTPSRNCQDYVLEQKLQIGITAPPIDSDKFDAFLLRKRKYYLIVGKLHSLSGRSSVKLEELRGEEAITLFSWSNQNDPVAEFCLRYGMKTDTRLSYLDIYLIVELLETGRYIIFSDDSFLVGDSLRRIEVEDLDMYIEFYLIVNKRAFINRAAELFIDWTREQFAGNG